MSLLGKEIGLAEVLHDSVSPAVLCIRCLFATETQAAVSFGRLVKEEVNCGTFTRVQAAVFRSFSSHGDPRWIAEVFFGGLAGAFSWSPSATPGF